MSDDGPKLPKAYYSGPAKELAETIGEALSSIESYWRFEHSGCHRGALPGLEPSLT
jgi:hypothetical protein